ncbi:MAG: hypothetical protein A2W52_02115 [Candidatus Taylorbacteria bacterium RIFCSPHIGHO2_02_49_25]|uniref:Type II secretion system protein GspF domain-containing protein n=1 Tax=Candidatus Taylorbacteria bacterium RIFCSPHIGHO2_02_49_25 TaxID=1802305 RepID=A0A1G2MKJ0_9BACT|nr:MAG: Type II secretion system protein [Parcubacteria group bacterium GW2011_GWF2_50_9]OHA20645.1 MAG: hypothetical protein A2759_01325 [Candidatus Taylorbacteria bacterium RIFCSPHIGHO2_01_FULL_49_60]OHA23502.1 MAG: hypothetical protein A2W52_02115 [Candidatus Taylorbacteria bacterium RIFCSPHIGHO2_02_49_25]OHA36325.1 MAG: hypothetical protein A3B27_01360 [Candidatus Taylorbacteria bacterium RIFCSPLOWO2_01_FULL_50_130]OHA36855.1 MAG: hypothetical protein A2W65_00105 [Candidatus Taylorbacteria 
MRLKYKAQKTSGEFYEGERDATDKFTFARDLRKEGETLISASLINDSRPLYAFATGRLFLFFRRISAHDKIAFVRNLASMLGAGLTVSRSLAMLERQTRSKKLKSVITGVSGRISGGESLSQALAEYADVFQPLVVSMVKAGEEGGNLSASLFAVSDQLLRSYALQKKLKGALIYPVIVVSVMILVGVLLFVYVVPQLTSAFKEFNATLPISTKIVIGASEFLQHNLMLGVIVLAAALGGLLFAAKSQSGKRLIHFAVLRIPFAGQIVREANAARVGQTLSSLLSSGVEVTKALAITADVLSNTYHKDVLAAASKTVERGDTMSGVFREHEHLFSPFLSEMIAVGEETGKLSGMLKEAGAFFEAEVDQKIKNISTIIEPALMVAVGIAVGFFAVAMISPAYSLMNSI